MAYIAVPTVSTGDVWTATNHNVYVRDNFRAVAPAIVTQAALLVGTGANTFQELAISGSNVLVGCDTSFGVGVAFDTSALYIDGYSLRENDTDNHTEFADTLLGTGYETITGPTEVFGKGVPFDNVSYSVPDHARILMLASGFFGDTNCAKLSNYGGTDTSAIGIRTRWVAAGYYGNLDYKYYINDNGASIYTFARGMDLLSTESTSEVIPQAHWADWTNYKAAFFDAQVGFWSLLGSCTG